MRFLSRAFFLALLVGASFQLYAETEAHKLDDKQWEARREGWWRQNQLDQEHKDEANREQERVDEAHRQQQRVEANIQARKREENRWAQRRAESRLEDRKAEERRLESRRGR